jgi:hypothetical protein
MNFSVSSIAAGFIFGVIGLYLVRRAKREANIASLLIGVAMMIYPYFIENDYLIWGIGVALTFGAYVTR